MIGIILWSRKWWDDARSCKWLNAILCQNWDYINASRVQRVIDDNQTSSLSCLLSKLTQQSNSEPTTPPYVTCLKIWVIRVSLFQIVRDNFHSTKMLFSLQIATGRSHKSVVFSLKGCHSSTMYMFGGNYCSLSGTMIPLQTRFYGTLLFCLFY